MINAQITATRGQPLFSDDIEADQVGGPIWLRSHASNAGMIDV